MTGVGKVTQSAPQTEAKKAELNAKLGQIDTNLSSKETEKSGLFKSKQDTVDRVEVSQAEANDAASKVNEATQKVASATSALESSITALNQAEEQLNNALSGENPDEATINQLKASVERAKNQVEKNKAELETAKNAEGVAKDAKEKADAACTKAQEALTKAEDALTKADNELNALKQEKNDVEKQLVQVSAEEVKAAMDKEDNPAGKMLAGIATVYGTDKNALLDKIAAANGGHIINEDGDGNYRNDAAYAARAAYFANAENDDKYYEKAEIYVKGQDVKHNSTKDKSLRDNTDSGDSSHKNDTATAVSANKLIDDLGGVDNIAKEAASHFGLDYNQLSEEKKFYIAHTVSSTLLQMSDYTTMKNSQKTNVTKDSTGIGFHIVGNEWRLPRIIDNIKQQDPPIPPQGKTKSTAPEGLNGEGTWKIVKSGKNPMANYGKLTNDSVGVKINPESSYAKIFNHDQKLGTGYRDSNFYTTSDIADTIISLDNDPRIGNGDGIFTEDEANKAAALLDPNFKVRPNYDETQGKSWGIDANRLRDYTESGEHAAYNKEATISDLKAAVNNGDYDAYYTLRSGNINIQPHSLDLTDTPFFVEVEPNEETIEKNKKKLK